jgi:dihydrofolate synthase/folylpolyglutamate synthase
MNYHQTIDFIFSMLPMYQRLGAAAYKADIKNTELLCAVAGNPYKKFPSVHVAGTNGKGSVSHLLASILQTKGLKTGLYTSPHLVDFRERIRINGTMIPEENVVAFVEKYKKNIEEIEPSFFEMSFVMAIEYFASQNVDIAIIETGMGGRLDSTNIITPILSIITNIDYDHTQFLGNTLEKIASEKAGIIKQNVTVVIGESNPLTDKVFIEKAKSSNSKIIFADKIISLKHKNNDTNNLYNSTFQTFQTFKKGNNYIDNINCPLKGFYQSKNLKTLLCSVEELNHLGYYITEDILLKGIENVKINTGLKGRWDIVSESPLIICDTAHNKAGITEIVNQLNSLNKDKIHFIIGVVNDKDLDNILKLLPQKKADYYYCKADIPRGLDSNILANTANNIGLKGNAYNSVKEAAQKAIENASENDIVFIGGSTFVVADFFIAFPEYV